MEHYTNVHYFTYSGTQCYCTLHTPTLLLSFIQAFGKSFHFIFKSAYYSWKTVMLAYFFTFIFNSLGLYTYTFFYTLNGVQKSVIPKHEVQYMGEHLWDVRIPTIYQFQIITCITEIESAWVGGVKI